MSPNDFLASIGASPAKSLAPVLLLPPLPLLLLVAGGAACLARRHLRSGWTLVLLGLAGVWLSQCLGLGQALELSLLAPPPALSAQDLATMKRAHVRRVVLVLGGGREPLQPEYGQSHLSLRSAQRLHYALYLARRIDAPVMYSGGTGFGEPGDTPEAEVAARIAERDFGQRLRWLESASRDTRENARLSLELLAREGGVDEIVLVSSSWHLPRALRAFREGAANWSRPPRLVAAPVSDGGKDTSALMRWLPTPGGAQLVISVLRERLGLMFGA